MGSPIILAVAGLGSGTSKTLKMIRLIRMSALVEEGQKELADGERVQFPQQAHPLVFNSTSMLEENIQLVIKGDPQVFGLHQ